jgi:hypothetical protein
VGLAPGRFRQPLGMPQTPYPCGRVRVECESAGARAARGAGLVSLARLDISLACPARHHPTIGKTCLGRTGPSRESRVRRALDSQGLISSLARGLVARSLGQRLHRRTPYRAANPLPALGCTQFRHTPDTSPAHLERTRHEDRPRPSRATNIVSPPFRAGNRPNGLANDGVDQRNA